MAKQKKAIPVCKSLEQCVSCSHRIGQIVQDGDEVEITCEFETEKGYIIEDNDLEECEQYEKGFDVDMDSQVDEENLSANVAATEFGDANGANGPLPEGSEVMALRTALFVLVGDALVQVKQANDSSIEMPIKLAEAFNQKVEALKIELVRQIEEAKAEHVALIEAAKEQLIEGNFEDPFNEIDDDDDFDDDVKYAWEDEEDDEDDS